MRHGYSILNYYATIKPKEKNRFDPELIDCALHDKGIQECKNANDKINSYSNLKYVFVSPLVRARQTALLSTATHPNKHNIKYYIHPLLRETVSRASDIPSLYAPLKEENASLEFFPDFKNPYYYLSGVKYEQEVVEKAKGLLLQEYARLVAIKMSELYPTNFETATECLKRSEEFLAFVKEFAKKKNAQDGEILIVTHSQIIRNAITIDIGLDNANNVDIYNCFVYELKLKL